MVQITTKIESAVSCAFVPIFPENFFQIHNFQSNFENRQTLAASNISSLVDVKMIKDEKYFFLDKWDRASQYSTCIIWGLQMLQKVKCRHS